MMGVILWLFDVWIVLWLIRGLVWIIIEALRTAIGSQR